MKYILILLLTTSCIGHKKHSGEEHFTYDEVNRQIYHSAWKKPLTWNDIEATGIDSLRNKYLLWYAERD